VSLLFNEFRAIAFDEEFAKVRRLRVELLFLTLLALISLVVVTLIQIVGVILVIALLTVPAATARQWCDGLLSMMVVASILGALCTTCGLFISYWCDSAFSLSVPSGPVIILTAVLAFALSSIARKVTAR